MYRNGRRCKHVNECDEIHVQIERKMEIKRGHVYVLF